MLALLVDDPLVRVLQREWQALQLTLRERWQVGANGDAVDAVPLCHPELAGPVDRARDHRVAAGALAEPQRS